MKSLRSFFLIIGLAFLLLSPTVASAQCAMCKQAVTSNIEGGEGKVVGRGLNEGILYLMSIPYLVLGGIGYMVWKNWKGGTSSQN